MKWKTIISEWLPDKSELLSNKLLQTLGSSLQNENIWRFNRRSVARAAAIGLFCAFLPMPFEMLPAAIGAIWLGGNLPLSVALVWISNPITWIPLYTPAYLLGNWILDKNVATIDTITADVLIDSLASLWIGCLIIGTLVSIIAFISVNGVWRLKVRNEQKERRRRFRLLKKQKKLKKQLKETVIKPSQNVAESSLDDTNTEIKNNKEIK